jgi:hypothetical protein
MYRSRRVQDFLFFSFFRFHLDFSAIPPDERWVSPRPIGQRVLRHLRMGSAPLLQREQWTPHF